MKEHIETKYYFLRNQVNKKMIDIVYYNTEQQIVDRLTKPLKIDRFVKLGSKLGMQSRNLN